VSQHESAHGAQGAPFGPSLLPLTSLLAGVGMLVIGVGLLFSVLGIRANLSGFSSLTLGLVMSAYYLGFLLGSFVCPPLIRRIGLIRAFSAMASLASTVPILHSVWVDPWFWGFLRLITGLCVMGMYVVIESWLNTAAPSHLRGKVFGAYMVVCSAAGAIGQWLILVGDKMSFVPFALVSILFSFALLPITLTPLEEPEIDSAQPFNLVRLFNISPLGVAGVTVAGVLNGAFFGLGASFAQNTGLSENGVASFMGATLLGGALFQWPVGHYSDQHDRRWVLFWVCLFGAVVAAVGFFASELVPLTWLETTLVAVGFVYGGMSFSVYGLMVAHVNDLIKPSEVVEITTGLLLMYGVGAILGPAVVGLVMNLTDNASFLAFLAVVMALLAGYTLQRLPKRQPVPEATKTDFVLTVDGVPTLPTLDPRGVVPGSDAVSDHD
jgi:MFS family permease